MVVSRVFKRCFKGVSRVFRGCFKGVSKVFQGCFKSVSRKFKGCLKCCFVVVSWYSWHLPKQKEGFFEDQL